MIEQTDRSRRVGTAAKLAVVAGIAVGGATMGSGVAHAAGITGGNLLVCRVGSGTGSLVNTGNPVFLDEYSTTGTLVQSIALPTAASGANKALIASGTATSECEVNLSTDGNYAVLTGYSASPGGAASLSGTTAATVSRTIGRIKLSDGSVDTTTSLTDAVSANNPRAAMSTDGSSFWIVGGADGVRFANLGASTSNAVSTTFTNIREIDVFGGQLYVSSGSSTLRLGSVGIGIPTTTGQATTNLPGFPTTGSPYGFFFADLDAGVAGVDTLYVAEDTASGGQIQKYALVAGTWTAKGSATAAAVRGLTGSVSGSTVTLYGSTGGSGATGGGALYKFVDSSGYNAVASGAAASLGTGAGANTAFRGLTLAPSSQTPPADVPEAPWAILIPISALLVGLGAITIRRRTQPPATA